MKTELLKLLWRITWFMAISSALYFLYRPQNTHPLNRTGSTIQFVYQQF